MVWLDELLEWETGFARCSASVRPHSAFVSDGSQPSTLLLEHMAQAVAACLGYGALRSGESIRVGMIIGCRSFRCYVPRLPVGTRMFVEARCERGVDEVSTYAGLVLVDTNPVASAQMTVYHAEKPPV